MVDTFSFPNSKQVPSYEMLGIPKPEEEQPPAPIPQPQRPLSPMGEACSRMDLTAIHQILVNAHYRDDEGTNEVKVHSFLEAFFVLVCKLLCGGCITQKMVPTYIAAIVPGMDTTDEGHARS